MSAALALDLQEFYTSTEIDKIIPAMFEVSKLKIAVSKEGRNEFFKDKQGKPSKHAQLPDVLEILRDPLLANDLVIVQMPLGGMQCMRMLTWVNHVKSGQWFRFIFTAPLQKNDPQGAGAASTYLKRYSLISIFCLPEVDDDANATIQKRKPPTSPEEVFECNDEQREILWEIFKANGVSEDIDLMTKTKDFLIGSPMAALEEKARKYIANK